MRGMSSKVLRCFKPVVSRRSRVLILGSMPGPEALRKQEYYGFNGNHFWKIIPRIFGEQSPVRYQAKLRLVKRNRVALWDVLHSCVRPTALDSHIRRAKPNEIPALLRSYPNIRVLFINGRAAYSIFKRHFSDTVNRPVFYLPSTSPAHASLSVADKLEKWKVIKEWI